MRRWINIKLVGIALRIMRRIAADKIHTGSVRQMAREAGADILTIRQIITPK